eukprot:scaffold91606_cov45-Phaeocystis_antarctica.AAC.1
MAKRNDIVRGLKGLYSAAASLAHRSSGLEPRVHAVSGFWPTPLRCPKSGAAVSKIRLKVVGAGLYR